MSRLFEKNQLSKPKLSKNTPKEPGIFWKKKGWTFTRIVF